MIDLKAVLPIHTLLDDVDVHHVVGKILTGSKGIDASAEATSAREGGRGQHVTLEADRIPQLRGQTPGIGDRSTDGRNLLAAQD